MEGIVACAKPVESCDVPIYAEFTGGPKRGERHPGRWAAQGDGWSPGVGASIRLRGLSQVLTPSLQGIAYDSLAS